MSPSVYYDFDLASHVQGNVSLRPCYIHNLDLRYELYPSLGEQITVAAFYKRFNNPIEWTYTVAGGTKLIYSYENARRQLRHRARHKERPQLYRTEELLPLIQWGADTLTCELPRWLTQ